MATHDVVTIVNYGMGNIHSLVSAFSYLGAPTKVSGSARDIEKARTLVLPGVGAFPAAMEAIHRLGIKEAIYLALEDPTSKLLGICLGMQLLGSSSSEGAGADGLGLLNFRVERFTPSATSELRIPHIGFNSVSAHPKSILFQGMKPNLDFYFVHEFRATPGDPQSIESTSTYGQEFVAAIESGRVFGTQFHPEKSQTNGLALIRNFLRVPH